MKTLKNILAFIALISVATIANAVPSFSRQTGQECAACHIGGFGPQLTPYGIRFKIGGYTDTDGKGGKVPLSAILVASFNKTKADQSSAPTENTKVNNNAGIDEASVFLAGRIFENAGVFAQVTRDYNEGKTSLDQFDTRFVQTINLAGKDAVIGLSVNNNPSVQDPFNSFGTWSFPFTSSGLAPAPGSATLINGGLEQSVVGTSGYVFWNNSVYAELGTYRSLSPTVLNRIGYGSENDPGKLGNNTAYWRLAYFKDLKKQAYSIGVFGFNANIRPDRSQPESNKYRDIGIDGSYQLLGTREHIFTVNGVWVNERQRRNALFANSEADNLTGHLRERKVAASYYYKNTWGVSAARFDVKGTSDATLYGDGYASGSPNSAGYILQVDFTPWGKEDSWLAPYANVRFGAQYTIYNKFNGASTNYDGTGRNAKDNNTLYLFSWISL